MRMEWRMGSAGLAFACARWLLRLTAEALGEYITTYIVLTMRRRPVTPYRRWDQLGAVTAEEWRRFRAWLRCGSGRRSLPCRGGARAGEALASLISPQRRG